MLPREMWCVELPPPFGASHWDHLFLWARALEKDRSVSSTGHGIPK